jgi:hypothetical protein
MSGLSRDRAESCRGFVPEFETLRRADAVAFDHLQVAMDIIGGPMGNEVQGPGVRPRSRAYRRRQLFVPRDCDPNM